MSPPWKSPRTIRPSLVSCRSAEWKLAPCQAGVQSAKSPVREAPLQLRAARPAELVPEPEAGAHQRAELRRQRTVDREPPEQLGAAREHPPAPPARRVEHARQRRAQRGHDLGSERHVEVAHAVQVGDRAAAAGVVVAAGRRAARDLLEHAVERVEVAVARAPRAAGRAPACRAPGTAPGTDASAAAGPSAPPSPTSRSARPARGPARPTARCVASPNAPPGERPEEPDRVVLRAVALPVAGDHVLPAAPARRAPVSRTPSLSTALASDSRLCHATASRNSGSRATLAQILVRPEHVEPADREARAADREVGPERPLLSSTIFTRV